MNNLKNIIKTIKNKIKFKEDSEKNEIIDILQKKDSKENKFYIILCNKFFIFKGIYKYFNIKEKFIKIYGNEKNNNYISINNINEYKIYIDQNNTFKLLNINNNNNFIFNNNNSYILIKN
jgi:hypothetical protein